MQFNKGKYQNSSDSASNDSLVLRRLIDNLIEKKKLTYEEIVDLIVEKEDESKEEILIPVEIFKNRKLSVLELVVKFLKENKNVKFSHIAKLLNRDSRTIWSSYEKANKKYSNQLNSEAEFYVPIHVFANRNLSPLEALVDCLKSSFKMRLHQIAKALARDERTIWTIVDRIKKKK